MKRMFIIGLAMGLFLATGWLLGPAWSAELKVIQTQKLRHPLSFTKI
jgi:hypothetical protein